MGELEMARFLVPYQLRPCPGVVQSIVDFSVDLDTCHFLVARYCAMCHRSSRQSRLLRVTPCAAILLVACLVDSTFKENATCHLVYGPCRFDHVTSGPYKYVHSLSYPTPFS